MPRALHGFARCGLLLKRPLRGVTMKTTAATSIALLLAAVAAHAQTTERNLAVPDAVPECMERNGPNCVLKSEVITPRVGPPTITVIPPVTPPPPADTSGAIATTPTPPRSGLVGSGNTIVVTPKHAGELDVERIHDQSEFDWRQSAVERRDDRQFDFQRFHHESEFGRRCFAIRSCLDAEHLHDRRGQHSPLAAAQVSRSIRPECGRRAQLRARARAAPRTCGGPGAPARHRESRAELQSGSPRRPYLRCQAH
jgi:hypothetical protein